MKDRIRQIMEAQHMTQQVFAEFLGTTPATLSGIFNDRTRPTLSIVEMIKKKIPDISVDWLLFGIGDMYKHSIPSSEGFSPEEKGLSGGGQVKETEIEFPPTSSPNSLSGHSAHSVSNGVRNTPQNYWREDLKIVDKPKRHVTEIRVYYDDQTWESFVPSKK